MFPGTLSTRLSAIAGLLATAGAALLSVYLIRSHRDFVLHEVAYLCENVAETVRLSITHDMLQNYPEGVRQVVETLGEHRALERIRIFNKEGKIIYSSEPGEVGQLVDKHAEACYQCHEADQPLRHLDAEQRYRIYRGADGGRILSTIAVIPNEPRCSAEACHASPQTQSVLGVLDVGVSMEPTEQRLMSSVRRAGVMAGIAVLGLSGTLFLVVRRSVNRPVRRLIEATRRVARGDYGQKLRAEGQDEMAFLARSFNEMLESLNDSKDRLDVWISGLEHKVGEKGRELQEARRQAIQAEKLTSVGLMAAGVAHELNSPLMGIITFAHLVQRDLPPDSQGYKDLDTIVREANRCAVIIRGLLDFARDRKQDTAFQPCDLADLTRHALKLVRPKLKDQEVQEEASIADPLPRVDGDPVQLTQVLVNLMLNALQAMKPGGALTVTVDAPARDGWPHLEFPAPTEGLVRIRVRDTGHGIPAELLGKIFDPFFTTKPVGQGSGLGLSVSHGIVRRHGGHILAESNGRTGTEFCVLLPQADYKENSCANRIG